MGIPLKAKEISPRKKLLIKTLEELEALGITVENDKVASSIQE